MNESMMQVTHVEHSPATIKPETLDRTPRLLTNMSGDSFSFLVEQIRRTSLDHINQELERCLIDHKTGQIDIGTGEDLLSLNRDGSFTKEVLAMCELVFDRFNDTNTLPWKKRDWLTKCASDGQAFTCTAVPRHEDGGVAEYCDRLLIVIKAPLGRVFRCYDAEHSSEFDQRDSIPSISFVIKTGDVINFNESKYHELEWINKAMPEDEDDYAIPESDLCWFLNVPNPFYVD